MSPRSGWGWAPRSSDPDPAARPRLNIGTRWRRPCPIAGVAVTGTGMALRQWAITTLGPFCVGHVLVQPARRSSAQARTAGCATPPALNATPDATVTARATAIEALAAQDTRLAGHITNQAARVKQLTAGSRNNGNFSMPRPADDLPPALSRQHA